ncbi:MAG: caspase family protein, partial [Caldimonas sp.]
SRRFIQPIGRGDGGPWHASTTPIDLSDMRTTGAQPVTGASPGGTREPDTAFGRGAAPGTGGPGTTGGTASAPPAVIVAATATSASPSDRVSGTDRSAAPAGEANAPACTTAQQRLSGECQRQAELEALGGALQRCAQAARDEQPACLFSERVKSLLQLRERDDRLVSLALQSREARQAVLPGIRRKWALVIGVEQYPKVQLGGQSVRMPNAGNDARAIASELRSTFGYITSELVSPTRPQVVQRLNMLAAIAQPHDSLLVFFSGYGFAVANDADAVWALSDADPQDGRTVLSHADLARLLTLIDAQQVALISDSTLAGQLRAKAVDYNPNAAPDAAGLLERRAMVALTSGGSLPMASASNQGLSDFAAQLLGVLRRVSTWHVGGRIFREVQGPLIQAGRPFVPQYGAASENLHQPRADYVFERRQLDQAAGTRP